MNNQSLMLRMISLFAIASVVLLLGLGLLISRMIDQHFQDLDEKALAGKLQLVQHALACVHSRAELDLLPRQLNAALIGHPGLSLAIGSQNGMTLFATGEAGFPKSLFEHDPSAKATSLRYWKNQEGKLFASIAAKATLGYEVAPFTVAVALDTSQHQAFISKFTSMLWVIIVLTAILCGFAARMAVGYALAPLRSLRQKASGINANHLHYRISEESVPVELKDLVRTLNSMLGRLEEEFRRLSDFSSDLAHELRTPVSNMQMQTEVTLSRERTVKEYKEALYSNAEECARLSRMISDMLFLAKTDYNLVAPFKEVVDLVDEVSNVFSYFDGLAEGKNVTLRLEGHGSVRGDRMMLRRTITNLVSNAIRHTPKDGMVRVQIDTVPQNERLRLVIENNGESVDAVHLPRLFDRFYRVDASRQGSSEGVGLGLAIAKSIIVLHGGTITVQSKDGITRFEILLPHDRDLH